MPKRHRNQPEIADVVALVHALDSDQRRTPAELAAREKRLAPLLSPKDSDPLAVGLSWLDALREEDASLRTLHEHAESATRLTGFLVALLAIVLGWGATLGAFYFDGSGRVNAVSVLALLVVIPALFLLPFFIAALPPRLAERAPGGALLTALARGFSAGRLAPLLWRMFPHDLRAALSLLFGRIGRHQSLYASLQKWALLRWSQLFALTFQLTALAACLILVVFTDLAFGWSTTLTTGDAALDARRVHRVASTIAWPWRWAFRDAQPSLELIEESRYFRVAAAPVSPAQAARLGGWWRFVALTLVVYGTLPRLVTFAIARSRLRAATRAAALAAPGLSAVVRRLHRAEIESLALEPEAGPGNTLPAAPPNPTPGRSPAAIQAVINWAAVPVQSDEVARAFTPAQIVDAGGAASVADDLALAKRIGAGVQGDSGDVLIVVKAWEPPLMEFLDFLVTLRAALTNRSALVIVLPIGLADSGEFPPASPAQLKLWRDKLAVLGDPWLRVVASREEVLT